VIARLERIDPMSGPALAGARNAKIASGYRVALRASDPDSHRAGGGRH